MNQPKQPTNTGALATLVLVFFFWGFIAASNSVFIPFCKNYFNLSQFESQLIGTAFYGAYFIGSLILYILSEARGKDLLNKIGYKNGIIIGLGISILGALLMIPAVNSETLKPIGQNMDQIRSFSTGQKFVTSDKTVVLKKEAGDKYSLTIKNDASGQHLLTNADIVKNMDSAFAAPEDVKMVNGVPAKLSAKFGKDKLNAIVGDLSGEDIAFGNFTFILVALFIIALGFSLQQTCAQPFAIALGDLSTGTHRLNLGGSVNSFGTTVGPIIVSLFLFGTVHADVDDTSVSSVKTLYMIVAAVFALVAIIFAISKLPSGKNDEKFERAAKASRSLLVMTLLILGIITLGHFTEIGKTPLLLAIIVIVIGILFYSNGSAVKNPDGWGAMKYEQLIYGMIGIFVYVGVEVTIDNNFGALLKVPGYLTEHGLNESQVDKYISMYWGSLMIGRWTGAISVFNLSKAGKRIATVIVPFVAFAVVLFANQLKGNNVHDLLAYSICVVVAIAAFFYGQEKPVKTLLTVASLATVAMLVGVFTHGIVSVYSFIAGGLFCSVMWPSIFSLSISGLGKYTGQGSAFLIMMILGGAVIPPLQGAVGDIHAIGLHNSYLVAAVCFAFLALLALKLKSVLKAQGLDFDKEVAASH
ncbi:MAG TPA: MFS transporter [Chitinophagaceae bacterium]|jgi:fucose permease